MTVAARMRKYRRKLALMRALKGAHEHGVDVLAVVELWQQERELWAAIKDTSTADLFERNADLRYDAQPPPRAAPQKARGPGCRPVPAEPPIHPLSKKEKRCKARNPL